MRKLCERCCDAPIEYYIATNDGDRDQLVCSSCLPYVMPEVARGFIAGYYGECFPSVVKLT